jgi:hypothetical protein
MKRHKCNNAPSIMEGADVFDANEALREGNARPIGWYLADAAASLPTIADLLDTKEPNDDPHLIFALSAIPVPTDHNEDCPVQDEIEWVGSREQIQEAIINRHARLLGWYLRGLGEFLKPLAHAFDPPTDWRDLQVEFVRKGRGRRSAAASFEGLLRDMALVSEVRQASMRPKENKKSAIFNVGKKRRVSRAAYFRKQRTVLKKNGKY